ASPALRHRSFHGASCLFSCRLPAPGGIFHSCNQVAYSADDRRKRHGHTRISSPSTQSARRIARPHRRKSSRVRAMRILIAGASGAIGRALVRRLRANQHEVFALTQSRDSAPALKEIGSEPVIADALDAAAVKAALGRIRPDAVINELTSLPRHYTPA